MLSFYRVTHNFKSASSRGCSTTRHFPAPKKEHSAPQSTLALCLCHEKGKRVSTPWTFKETWKTLRRVGWFCFVVFFFCFPFTTIPFLKEYLFSDGILDTFSWRQSKFASSLPTEPLFLFFLDPLRNTSTADLNSSSSMPNTSLYRISYNTAEQIDTKLRPSYDNTRPVRAAAIFKVVYLQILSIVTRHQARSNSVEERFIK